MVKSDYTPTSALNLKKLVLRFNYKEVLGKVELLDSKGNLLITLTEPEETYDDCFLTTFCVEYMGKPDDCPELTGLRQFRDEVLLTSDEGLALVKEYYAIAPGIVKAIKSYQNRSAVFEGIYSDMILPTLEQISKQDAQGAIEIYKNYTYSLKEKFLS